MKNFFIKEEFSFFVLLYTFIKKDTILTLIYIVMKISHIEHLGIAVKSIEEALPYYENVLGLKCYNIETVEDQKVRTAFLKVGDVKIELFNRRFTLVGRGYEGTAERIRYKRFISGRSGG